MPRLATFVLFAVLSCAFGGAQAQERGFSLTAPDELVASGFLKYLLPRFSLKTQTRITLVAPGTAADAQFVSTPPGVATFEGMGRTWHLRMPPEDDAAIEHADRFLIWLQSEVGARTISTFGNEAGQKFVPVTAETETSPDVFVTGNAVSGAKLAMLHCGRCHAVTEAHKKNSIGSTPSFAALRTLPDWQDRFATFFVLNPHPSFTVIDDVTVPFSENQPPPIHPLNIDLEALDDIIAYAASIIPADLGAPIRYQ